MQFLPPPYVGGYKFRDPLRGCKGMKALPGTVRSTGFQPAGAGGVSPPVAAEQGCPGNQQASCLRYE